MEVSSCCELTSSRLLKLTMSLMIWCTGNNYFSFYHFQSKRFHMWVVQVKTKRLCTAYGKWLFYSFITNIMSTNTYVKKVILRIAENFFNICISWHHVGYEIVKNSFSVRLNLANVRAKVILIGHWSDHKKNCHIIHFLLWQNPIANSLNLHFAIKFTRRSSI
jgi:hypothetical protein